MGSSQQFSLRWNNYLKYITDAFDTLRTHEDLVDVTLSCEGKRIRAHKMLLSACSTYLRDLFKENPCQHPVIIFRNVKFDDLAALVKFMYQGEVNVVQEQLASFLTTAELLEVKGLTQDPTQGGEMVIEDDVEIPNEPEVQLQNLGGSVLINNKSNSSPSSPLTYHQPIEVRSGTPPNKKRKFRENSSSNAEKKAKENEAKSSESTKTTATTDPVEIIPLMPNLKMEMPEYLEQDGSSCSYEEQTVVETSNRSRVDGNSSEATDDHKPDISQTFYSPNQTGSDALDPASKTVSDTEIKVEPYQFSTYSESGEGCSTSLAVYTEENWEDPHEEQGHMHSKPGTSSERTQESSQDIRTVVVEQPSHSCKLCGKSFWNRDSMYKHMNMHKGTTQCPVCHKVLSRTTHMKRHLKNRHGWLGFAVAPTENVLRAAGGATGSGGGGALSQPMAGQQGAGATSSGNGNSDVFTTIRIRESSVERITSSPIP